jgi:hypothetical protein
MRPVIITRTMPTTSNKGVATGNPWVYTTVTQENLLLGRLRSVLTTAGALTLTIQFYIIYLPESGGQTF